MACSSGPSTRLTWLGAISIRVPSGGRVLHAAHLDRNSARNSSAPKSRTPSLPHLLSTNQTVPKLAMARPKKIQAIGRPMACSAPTNTAPATMKPACKMLPAAMMRARVGRRGPGLHGGERRHHEQAAAEGEQEEVGQHAEAAKRGRERRRVTSLPSEVVAIAQARSRPIRPITMAPIGTSARLGRTWLSCAANSEPAAMPIANTARHSVTDAPRCRRRLSLISAGSSDSTIAPTIQNQDTITMPSHSRCSA